MSDTAVRSIVDDAVEAFEQHQQKVLEANERVHRDNLAALQREASEVVERTLHIKVSPTSWAYRNDNLITYELDPVNWLGYCYIERFDYGEHLLFLVTRCPDCDQFVKVGSQLNSIIDLGREISGGELERHKVKGEPCNYTPRPKAETVEERLTKALADFVSAYAPGAEV